MPHKHLQKHSICSCAQHPRMMMIRVSVSRSCSVCRCYQYTRTTSSGMGERNTHTTLIVLRICKCVRLCLLLLHGGGGGPSLPANQFDSTTSIQPSIHSYKRDRLLLLAYRDGCWPDYNIMCPKCHAVSAYNQQQVECYHQSAVYPNM